jgi:hypothetical protein
MADNRQYKKRRDVCNDIYSKIERELHSNPPLLRGINIYSKVRCHITRPLDFHRFECNRGRATLSEYDRRRKSRIFYPNVVSLGDLHMVLGHERYGGQIIFNNYVHFVGYGQYISSWFLYQPNYRDMDYATVHNNTPASEKDFYNLFLTYLMAYWKGNGGQVDRHPAIDTVPADIILAY